MTLFDLTLLVAIGLILALGIWALIGIGVEIIRGTDDFDYEFGEERSNG